MPSRVEQVLSTLSKGPVLPPGFGPKKIGAYTWTDQMKPLREHFALELTTLDLLIKSKYSALRQDHLSTVVYSNQIKECLNKRYTQFYSPALREQHNHFNQLWKWLTNTKFALIARNRILLNSFFAE